MNAISPRAAAPSAPAPSAPTPSAPAPDEAAERRARHLRYSQEMLERGMTLMRNAANRAEAETAADTQTTQEPEAPTPGTPRRPDPNLIFSRLCRTVRQTMLLEDRIATGAPNRTPHQASTTDRHRALRHALDTASVTQPDRARLRRTLYERVEHDLADPQVETAELHEILANICQDFGLEPDYTQMPDDILAIFCPEPPDYEPPDPEDATFDLARLLASNPAHAKPRKPDW